MGARDRLFATITIWGAFVVTSVVLFDKATGHYPSNISELTLIVVMGLISAAAVFGTFAVWRSWSYEARHEKQKHAQSRRIARLADAQDEMLDDAQYEREPRRLNHEDQDHRR